MRPRRVEPGPGQESVWDYPARRPSTPATTTSPSRFGGVLIADSHPPVRVLETSQPPAYYLPADDVRTDLLVPGTGRSFCEWKGAAPVLDRAGRRPRSPRTPPGRTRRPTDRFAAIRDHLAFYPRLMDECTVDGEVVDANEGTFYGGWITSKVVGPFKGAPGTMGW